MTHITDRNTMERKLNIIGYGREYLEYLNYNQLKKIYYDEFRDIDG